jgi:hypothetical protein
MSKYVYEYVIQGFYDPYGWEDVTAESTRKAGKDALRVYRAEDDVARDHRLVTRRTLRGK